MAATLIFGFAAVEVPDGFNFFLECTRQFSTGRSVVDDSEYRLIGVLSFEDQPGGDYVDLYNAKFGHLIAGTKIFWRCAAQDTFSGERSGWSSGVAIVT